MADDPSPGASNALAVVVFVVAVIAAALALLFLDGTLASNNSNRAVAVVCLGGGAFCVAGSSFGWNRFSRIRRARAIAAAIGLNGARYFYGAIGGILVGLGVAMLRV